MFESDLLMYKNEKSAFLVLKKSFTIKKPKMKYKKTQSKTIPPLLKEMEKNVKKLYKSDSQSKSSFVICSCTHGRKANRVIETHLHQTPE